MKQWCNGVEDRRSGFDIVFLLLEERTEYEISACVVGEEVRKKNS